MPKEIELKFLYNSEHKIEGELIHSYFIKQGYIANGKNHVVRARHREDLLNSQECTGFTTLKSKTADIDCDEYEYSIPPNEALELIRDSESSLSKIRHVFLIDDLHFEVDEFSEGLEGLTLIEIEFKTKEEADAFDSSKYSFLGKDVSRDKEYSNYVLSLVGNIKEPVQINVKEDFSDCPFGRYLSDGDNSGERFREDFLAPALKDDSISHIGLDFKGLEGLLSSGFLEESFGGLVRVHNIHPMIILSKINFINIEKDIMDDIKQYIMDMSDFKINNYSEKHNLDNIDIVVIVFSVNNGDYETIHVFDNDREDDSVIDFLSKWIYQDRGIVDTIEIHKILK